MSDIKSCPFCGEQPMTGIKEYFGDTYDPQWQIGCITEKCIAEYPIDVFFETEQKAIEAWNRRPKPKEIIEIKPADFY